MADWQFYDSFREYLGDGTLDMDDDTFGVDLVGSGYTFSASHSTLADLGANILSGSGYTTQTLTSVTWTRAGASVDFGAADPVFQPSGGDLSPVGAVLWSDTPTSPADPLVAYLPFGSTITLRDGMKLRIDMSAGVT